LTACTEEGRKKEGRRRGRRGSGEEGGIWDPRDDTQDWKEGAAGE